VSENLARQFLLNEDVIFLNHGSYGACPRTVFETYQSWQLQLEQQPVAFLDPARGLGGWMRDARVALSQELGTDADNIVGVTNATAGLNIVARSLDLKAGDEILTSAHEYDALDKTWEYVALRTGARIKIAETPLPLTSERQFTEAILSSFTEHTKVLFLSHITSETALLFPVEKAVEAARERGIITIIDGAHAVGHIPLDLEELGADFYAGNCHKWLMAPKGSAFLYASPQMQEHIDPLIISHGWTKDAKEAGAKGAFGNSPFIDGLEMQGTRDPAAWLSVPAVIEFRKQHDWDQVARRCRDLAQETAERVGTLTGLAPLSSHEFCAPQMVAIPIPDCDIIKLQHQLLTHYNIEVPVIKWQQHTVVRLSVAGYNTQAQMDTLVEALSELLGLEVNQAVFA
jgi:isopenicillin-N epimerase